MSAIDYIKKKYLPITRRVDQEYYDALKAVLPEEDLKKRFKVEGATGDYKPIYYENIHDVDEKYLSIIILDRLTTELQEVKSKVSVIYGIMICSLLCAIIAATIIIAG